MVVLLSQVFKLRFEQLQIIFKSKLVGLIQGYIFWPFLSKLKNREEFEGGLEKGKKKGGKKEKSDKTHVKIPLRSLNDRKKIHQYREEF